MPSPIQEALNGKSPIQVAVEEQLKSKPKREIPRPDPGLNLFERFAGAVDRGMQTLDRFHSATNAAANELARQGANVLSASPTPDDLQKQGMSPIQAAVEPFVQNVRGLAQAVPKAAQAGVKAYQNNDKVGMNFYTQNADPNASTTEQLIRRALDLSMDIQTDPVALTQYLGVVGAMKTAGAGLKVAKQIPAVQRGLARANAIVDPLAQSAMRSAPGAFVTRLLGNFGQGPHQAMRRELIRPHELEIANAARPVQEVLSDVQRETLRLRKLNPQYDTLIQDYGAQHGGANPVEELLRRTIKERATAGSSRVPFNQLTPTQKATMVKKYANPFGVSPTWLIDQADKTLAAMDATEFQLLKAGVTPGINKGGAANKAVDVDQWLEGMFGKPALVRPSTPGALVKPTQVPTQMREAGIRNFINDLPNHTDWVRPVTPGAPDPGWVEIPQGGVLGSKLAGYQVPAPLKAFLDTELAAGGLEVSNEPKSWYIQNKDLSEWVAKNVVGTVKKGLIAATSTQTANLASNNLVSQLAIKRGLSRGVIKALGGTPDSLLSAKLKGAFQDVMDLDKGKKVAGDINEIRKFSNSFDATENSTSFFGGGPRPAMEGSVIGSGTKFAYREPTLGEAAGALYPPNHLANFQGVAERAYKLATYRVLRDGGLSSKEAAALVEKHLFDYSDRGPLLEIFDKFGFWPFATYPTKAFGLLMDTVVNHPEMLAKFPRLRQLAARGYETNMQNVDPRYVTPFTFPYGNPADKNLVDLQRFVPFGAGIEGATNLAEGQGLVKALTSAVGLGRAGQGPLESVINTPLGARLYGIAQGISPFSEAGKPKGLLQPGEPASDLPALQQKELLRNFAPSQTGGRGTIALQDVLQGKPSTDYAFQQPRTLEDTILQHGLEVRTFKATTPTDNKRNQEVKSEVKSRASDEVKDFMRKAKDAAETAKENPETKTAAKFNDPGQIKRELQDAKTRLKSLPISGRVSVKGKLTDEGREKIQKQLYYIYALKARLKEVARGR